MWEELSIPVTSCVITVMCGKSYKFLLHLVSSLSCVGRVINSCYILCHHCHVWEELSIPVTYCVITVMCGKSYQFLLYLGLQCQIIHVPEVYCKTVIVTLLWSVLRCDENQVQYSCMLYVVAVWSRHPTSTRYVLLVVTGRCILKHNHWQQLST